MPRQDSSSEKTKSALLKRIERAAGVPDLTEVLSCLPPTDLQSLLLEVFRIAASRRQPSDLLADYRDSRFARPSNASPLQLIAWEHLAFSLLPPGFEPIELAPTCPLGTSSVTAAVDQNWAVSTVRNIEVVSDPTNVMALECAVRRRDLLSKTPKSQESVDLAARHRVLRPQRYANSSFASHFSLFSLCSAGRDRGSRHFELSVLRTHCQLYFKALRAFLGPDRRLVLSLTDFGGQDDLTRLESEFLAPLRDEFANVTCAMNDQRTSGRGYYRDLCCKIHVEGESGELIEVGDGGSVDWTQKLLSDSKERLVVSAIGSERVCAFLP